MKECYYRENGAYCYFHSNELFVGVCPLCLNERLLILAAKQGINPHSYKSKSKSKLPSNVYKSKPSISFTKIFALGSLLNRRDFHSKSSHDFADALDTTSTSLEEDSFISIKFGDNGVALWEKSNKNMNMVSKVSLQQCSMSWGGQAGQAPVKHGSRKGSHNNNDSGSKKSVVVEHVKPQSLLRWRKRIGQFIQVMRCRRSNKGSDGGGNCKSEGVKVARNDRSWISTPTSRIKTKK